jgi:hypothetical protein
MVNRYLKQTPLYALYFGGILLMSWPTRFASARYFRQLWTIAWTVALWRAASSVVRDACPGDLHHVAR